MPSDAPRLKMSNGFAQKSNDNRTATKWLQHVQRREASRRTQTIADSLSSMSPRLSLSLRPPAEPPPSDTILQSVMTGTTSYPDQDAVSVSSTNTFNSLDSNDSLFGIPLLARCGLFSSSDGESVSSSDNDEGSFGDEPPPLQRRGSISSSDHEDSHLFHNSNRMEQYAVETVTSESSFDTAYEDDRSISTTESLFPSTFDNLGPPPPSSLMDLWDTPFSKACLHNFKFPGDDAKCQMLHYYQ
jgi:hypothetical protein